MIRKSGYRFSEKIMLSTLRQAPSQIIASSIKKSVERPELPTTNRSCRDCLRGGKTLAQALGQSGRHGDGKKCWIGLP